eukprot:SAG31_NODE_4509_length_3178_cov_13.049367_5_plen_36_part_00
MVGSGGSRSRAGATPTTARMFAELVLAWGTKSDSA